MDTAVAEEGPDLNTNRPRLEKALQGKNEMQWDSRGDRRVHLFTPDEVLAVDTALGAERPLLVLGEPGSGKTQLGAAVAAALGCPFAPYTVDARTEPGDLLYRIDYVSRLAKAQVIREIPTGERDTALDEEGFLIPGPLWWALDFEGARGFDRGMKPERSDCFRPDMPVVVLIDEIDKAEPDVPNSLLEVLGEERFRAPSRMVEREPERQVAPLVIIASNDERDLPDAFLRRCVVMVISFEEGDSDFLPDRGKLHFPELHPDVVAAAALDLLEDRRHIVDGPRPGLAEYLDMLRVLARSPEPANDSVAKRRERQLDLLKQVRRFTFQKFAEIHRVKQGRGG